MRRKSLIIGIFGLLLLAGCAVQGELITIEPQSDQQTEPQVAIQSLPIHRVVYPKPDGPWIWTEGEEPRRLASSNNTENVRISDDGQAVAYQAEGGLYAILLDEDGPNLLVDRVYLDSLTPPGDGFVTINTFDFGARSHFVYFDTRIPGRKQNDLYRVAAGGGTPERIFAPGDGGNLTFSPDGQWMTIYQTLDIVLSHQDGMDAHTVFTFPDDVFMASQGPQIVWAQDSSGFSVIARESESEMSQRMTVWFVPIHGNPIERMHFYGYPATYLSPDGSSVVYFHDHDGTSDIHFVDSQGVDTLYASLGQHAYFMEWSPDSRHFIINYVQEGSSPSAWSNIPYLCEPGADPIRLTDTPTAYPSYWVDAQRVLFYGDGLRLQVLGKPSMLIDEGLLINDFDFTLITSE
ncbi:MAG: PD40 domain-containing protein [Anaerolineaceae bacterium]|nr:PD40 domain-containing protein [Anaerolineaceae bacterium]MBN2677511.1 PD40 domain-containing protein [Anaerolineaceae bacterium]